MKSSVDKEVIECELKRLRDNCEINHCALRKKSHKIEKQRKYLTIIAGSLAIISGGFQTAVMTNIISAIYIQIISVVLSIISGIIAIVIGATAYNERDITNLFTGSSKYLELRDQVNEILVYEDICSSTFPKKHRELNRVYFELDYMYSKYIYIEKEFISNYLPKGTAHKSEFI